MAGGADRFQRAAAEAGISLVVSRFPDGTRTAADAARAIGCEIGQIVKSLVFLGDGRAFLALTSGLNRADPERLADLVNAKDVRRASPEEARDAAGFAIGGTPPFGHPRRLKVLVDRDLLAYPVVWAAAGTPDSVFPISPEELVRASGGEVADFRDRGDPTGSS